MATSEINLYNMVLIELGKDRITSLDDGTEEANDISVIKDEARREVISEGQWKFSTKRIELSLLDEAPLYEYSYQFQLPTDFIKIWSINECSPDLYSYSIEGDKLLIDNTSVQIRYSADVENVALWSSYFKQTYRKYLASILVYKYRADVNLRNSLIREYEMVRDKGLALDTVQGSRDRINKDEFIEDR